MDLHGGRPGGAGVQRAGPRARVTPVTTRSLIWGENRPEWIVAFWGALLSGIPVVPIDYRASADFVQRVQTIVGARLMLTGDEVAGTGGDHDLARWPASIRMRWRPPVTSTAHLAQTRAAITKDDVAEIIFTSGATAEPKGVLITHRNILANIVPIEREIAEIPAIGPAILPDPVPEPAAAEPHVRPGDGDLRAADAAGRVMFMRGYNPPEIVAADQVARGSRCWCRCRRSSTSCANTSAARSRRRRNRIPDRSSIG